MKLKYRKKGLGIFLILITFTTTFFHLFNPININKKPNLENFEEEDLESNSLITWFNFTDTGDFLDWYLAGSLDAYSDDGDYLYARQGLSGDIGDTSLNCYFYRDVPFLTEYDAGYVFYIFNLYNYMHSSGWDKVTEFSISFVYNDSSTETLVHYRKTDGTFIKNETYIGVGTFGKHISQIQIHMYSRVSLWLSQSTQYFYLYDEFW